MTDESIAEVVEVVSAPQDEEVSEVQEVVAEPVETETQAVEVAETGEKDPEILDTDSKGVQDRINKVIKQRYTAQGETKEVQQKLEEALAKLATFQKEPSLDDPDINHDPVAYRDALRLYDSEQASNTNTAVSQADTAKAEKVAAFSEKLTVYRAEKPDYDSVVGTMPVTQDTSDALVIAQSPEAAYYLGNHLDVLDEINSLPLGEAVLRISELSRSLQPAQPKQSQAPDPVTSVATGGGTTTKSTDDMSITELAAYDAARFAAQNG